jgi:hypothetical protein
MDRYPDGQTKGWKYRQTDILTNKQMTIQIGGQRHRKADGQTEGWKDRQTGILTNKQMTIQIGGQRHRKADGQTHISGMTYIQTE